MFPPIETEFEKITRLSKEKDDLEKGNYIASFYRAQKQAFKEYADNDENINIKPKKTFKKIIHKCDDEDDDDDDVVLEKPEPKYIEKPAPTIIRKDIIINEIDISIIEDVPQPLQSVLQEARNEQITIKPVVPPPSVLQEARNEQITIKPVVPPPSVLQEARHKLQLPAKPKFSYGKSNAELKNDDLQDKYNKLVIRSNAENIELKRLKQEVAELKALLEKAKPKPTANILKDFIDDNYEITTDRNDKIKCSEIYDKFMLINQSYTQQGFIKALSLINIDKCRMHCGNMFYCIKEKEVENLV